LPQCSTADSAYLDEFFTWKFKFELNDGCLLTSNGGFGVITVQRDLPQIDFRKTDPWEYPDRSPHLHLHPHCQETCTWKKFGRQMRQKYFAYLMIPNGHEYGAR
jgi:hypothetical protein